MIKIEKNISLKKLNTFHIEALAEKLISFDQLKDIVEIIEDIESKPFIILGGGSNILFTKDFRGTVIQPQLKNIQIKVEKGNIVTLKVGSGVIWDEFVQYCVDNNFGGIENLSLIPGCVGASPIQNIGAYGVEVKDVIERVDFFDVSRKIFSSFSNNECDFGYRDSIFKNKLKGNVIITSVTFNLTLENHKLNLEYGNLREELDYEKVIGIKAVRNAVIKIRERKLPDPKIIGNAGSFFKNPVIESGRFEKMKEKYPLIPSYKVSTERIKIPAAWLIEQTGWKGKESGNVAVHKNQPLVIINKSGLAKGEEVLALARNIINDVVKMFAIKLEMEVNIF